MTEKKLPPLALGAWSWGTGMAGGDQVFGNHYFEDDLRPVFDKAMEKGLTLWDTAAVYGEGTSERILGNFVKDVPREDVLISTKFTPQIAGPGDDAMEKMLEGSLSRLHTDYVDIYWIHNPMDVERWTKDLIPLAKSGKIRKIGVSNHNLAEIKRAQEILAEGGLSISSRTITVSCTAPPKKQASWITAKSMASHSSPTWYWSRARSPEGTTKHIHFLKEQGAAIPTIRTGRKSGNSSKH